MNPEQQDIVACMDAFVEELLTVVDQTIRQTIAVELERIRANPHLGVKKPKVPRRPKREPGEVRARAPRRPRAVKERTPRVKTVTRSSGSEAPAPAPLFVYKRAKDGRIERLNRRDEADEGSEGTPGSDA